MTIDLVCDILSWILIVTGSAFSLIGGIGLVRLPDLYSRMHAGGITDTMGAGLVVAGLAFQSGFSLVTVKLGMILFFLWITSPTSGHALARAALAHGLRPWTAETDSRGLRTKEVPPSTP